jgi:ankyrin repeat protein
MLAVAGGDLDCVKALLGKGVDYRCEDDYGNNVLHIAAINGSNQILEFLCKNLKMELFERNKAGDSALSIC